MNYFIKFKKIILRHHVFIIVIISLLISIVSFFYYFNADLITAYGDSRGHLNIARRIVDSYSPGFAQLGGYWLPLLHILMLPTIWIDFFWSTGVSGSIPNMLSFIISVVYIYKLVYRLTRDKLSSLIAFILSALNLNFIYMQATPMTESLFICTLVLSIYFLHLWLTDQKKIQFLILSSVFIILSSLNRYEGWLLAIGAIFLFFMNYLIKKFNKQAEGIMIIFSTLTVMGIILWIIWGATIFRDPFEFMHNDLSAGRQTTSAYGREKPYGEGSLTDAIKVNIFSAYHTSSAITVLLFIFSFFAYLYKKNKSIFDLKNSFLLLLIAPFMFDVLTVFVGNVPVEVPELSNIPPPGNYFNIRYSLYLIPAISIFIAIATKKKIFLLCLLIIIVINNFLFFDFYRNFKNIVTLKDAGVIAEIYPQDGLDWFKKNYDNGMVLASTGAFDAFMHDTKFKQKNFIVEGSYIVWDKSLVSPASYAKWILISRGNERDSLYSSLSNAKINKDYTLAYVNSNFTIYKRKW